MDGKSADSRRGERWFRILPLPITVELSGLNGQGREKSRTLAVRLQGEVRWEIFR
jgi:hypothetical protein